MHGIETSPSQGLFFGGKGTVVLSLSLDDDLVAALQSQKFIIPYDLPHKFILKAKSVILMQIREVFDTSWKLTRKLPW